MLGKLLKYDLRFGARTFAGLIAVLLFIGLVGPWLGDTIMALSGSVMMIVVMVTCIVLIVQSYYKSLFGNHGYLTRTLPVRVHALVTSKLLVTLFWFNLVCASVVLYAVLLTREFSALETIFGERFLDFAGVAVTLNCLALALILTAYLAIALGSVSIKGRRLGVAGYIAGGIVPVVAMVLTAGQLLPALTDKRFLFVTKDQGVFFSSGLFSVITENGAEISSSGERYLADGGVPLAAWDWFLPLAGLLVAVACYFGAVWLIKRKSNLQ